MNEIHHILCAVRSRPGGVETVERAIALALEHDARLTFCQVVDAGFVTNLSRSANARKAAYAELTDMAEFALEIICDQAELQGVEQVAHVVRIGDVRRELLSLVTEFNADILVLGRPKPTPGRSVFPDQAMRDFVTELEKTGVTVDY